ncbi:GAP family protein [Agromyces mediolanus]|uniref:GAP family protein n=1 Tax=Agromyces mediolanus TaxID=41986 RepID=UPI001E4C48D8|nr:GAP family protein [Agromyces mediolanus]MCD1572399.1 GAP family protein [Agromyces mediolanus]
MDLLTDAPLAITLAVLALVDGLSIGTLLIPVFLLLAPRLRGSRVLLYLVTIAVFYLLVGILFMLGLVNLVDVAQSFLSSTTGLWIRLLLGAGLLVIAFAMPTNEQARKKREAAAAERVASAASGGALPDAAARAADASDATPAAGDPAPGGRIARWRDRLLADGTSPLTVMAVALGAGLVEVATMLPYLVAMGMLAEAELSMPLRFGALAGYCLLMIAPALVLLVLRIVAAPLVKAPLERLAAWLERTASENTAWIVGIVGFILARSAASELGLFEQIL